MFEGAAFEKSCSLLKKKNPILVEAVLKGFKQISESKCGHISGIDKLMCECGDISEID